MPQRENLQLVVKTAYRKDGSTYRQGYYVRTDSASAAVRTSASAASALPTDMSSALDSDSYSAFKNEDDPSFMNAIGDGRWGSNDRAVFVKRSTNGTFQAFANTIENGIHPVGEPADSPNAAAGIAEQTIDRVDPKFMTEREPGVWESKDTTIEVHPNPDGSGYVGMWAKGMSWTGTEPASSPAEARDNAAAAWEGQFNSN